MSNLTAEQTIPTPLSNSPLLPFLLLALASQKYVPETKTCFKSEYDYIIVGAGSAGSVVASRLSEIPYINVLLLEAGNTPDILTEVPALWTYFANSYNDWGLSSVPQKHTARLLKDRKIPMTMGKALGGSSVLNGMLVVRGNAENFNGWERNGATGWGYKDVLPYFKKLESMQVPKYLNPEYHGFSGPTTIQKPSYDPQIKTIFRKAVKGLGYHLVDSNGANQYGIFDFTTTTRDGRRCSTAKAYLEPADQRTNLDIVPNAFVQKIIIENNQAVGVAVEIDGKNHLIWAKEEIILSAGALHTPQILMLSGVGPRKQLAKFKIPLMADLPVGQNFQDHIGLSLAFEISNEIPKTEQVLNCPQTILQYIANGTGALTDIAGGSYIGFLSNETVGSGDPDFQIYIQKVFLQKQLFDPSRIKGKNLASCSINRSQPDSRGWITLNSTDPHDPPLIDPKYFSHPEDIRKTVEGLLVCQKIFATTQLKSIGSKPLTFLDDGCRHYLGDNQKKYLSCLCRNYGDSYSHYAGSAKMGSPYDSTTVVCPELKVKGIKGLRVVDASVMPKVTSGNTNIPVIMIAEKASDMIKQQWFAKRA